MALSYPRPLPTVGVSGQIFRPMPVDTLSPDTGGRLRSASRGPALWEMVVTLDQAPADVGGDEWLAWAAALYGSQKHFLARDVFRPFPRAYAALPGSGLPRGDWTGVTRAGGGAFDGTVAAANWGVPDAEKVLVYLTTLPAGFVLSHLDWISFEWASAEAPGGVSHAWVQGVEPVVASGSGVLTVQVSPAVPRVVPAGATVRVSDCRCLMKLDTRRSSIDARSPLGAVSATLVGRQDLIP